MNIGFIGAGKVGVSLGKYLTEKSVTVSGYFSKSISSSQDAAAFTNSKCYLSIKQLVMESKIICITTNDDAIKSVWEAISTYALEDKIICHTSGSISSDVFVDIEKMGAYAYSIHPIYAFSDKYSSYKGLNNAYFSVEGSQKLLESVTDFITKLGNQVITINSDKKSLYHLANVMVSNMVLSTINIGCKLLFQCGVKEETAISALSPLILNNVENIINDGFIKSLTGPAERADYSTISNHLAVVPKEYSELYKILTLNLLKIAKQKNPDRDYTELFKLL